jgi:tape measure domain-containing protein
MEAVFDRLARTATAFLSVNMMENFISKMISVRSEFQQLEIAFTTMLGSKEKADKLTQDLIQFAGTTPFGMKDTADATKQLLAYGSEAGNVKNELRMLGDVASGVSQPIGELVYLYGTLRTQGRAYMMDIRQFAGRGIPIYQELAKVLGVSKDQVNALVTAGKVGFKEVEQAFKNMTAQGSMFGGLMEAQSHTIQGNLERLGDAFDQMLNSMGKDSEGVIGLAISGLSTLVENYDKVLAIMLGLVTTYGVYKAALIATAAWESSLTLITTARRVAALALGTSVASLTAVEVLHYTALIIAEKAQRLLNATMLANPYIAVGAVVAGLIVTMYSLEKSLTASQQAQQNFTDGNRKAIESMEAMKTKATELTNIVRDKTATDFQTNKAYEELQRLYPNLLANMSKEAFLKEESTKLQKELNNENDKSSLSVLSNRYDEAKNKVAAMTKELEGLKVAMRNDGSGGSGAAYSKLYKELEAAKIEAGLLGEELRKQQQEYAYSLMNDDQKLQFLQAQKAEIEKQRDAILKVNPQINDQNAIFGIIQDKTLTIASNLNSWNLVRFNNELTDILGKIKGIEDANKKDPNAGVRSENWFNDEIKKLKEANAPLSVYSPEYKANLAQIKKLEDELAKAQGKEKNTRARKATQFYNAKER